MSTSPQESPTIIIHNHTSNASGVASFIFGLISIFVLAPLFVPLAILFGIIAVINGQIAWGILGLLCASIGFVTSPILMGLAIVTGVGASLASHGGSTQQPLAHPQYIEHIDQSRSSMDDTLVEGAKLCTRYLPRHEREYDIPQHLLAAIASVESGRYHKELGLNLPWPWTINVAGTGYYFDTKQKAIDAVNGFQSQGISNINVGCMQVNLQQHPNAFATLEQAFDPAYNVAFAAQLLKKNFEQEGSWRKATADYHSHNPKENEQYAELVYDHWSRIINKVADAQAGKPILNTPESLKASTVSSLSKP